MKIGVACPIGPLDRYGYQYIYNTVFENLSNFATQVYVCSTSRNRNNVSELFSQYSKLTYVSSESTWFNLDDQGNEIFDINRIVSNVNLVLDQMRQDGMDCFLQIHANQYVPTQIKDPLLQSCQKMIDTGRPFEWLYKRYQLGDRLFHADTRLPWILNLQFDNPFRIAADSIRHHQTSEYYRIEHGDFRSKDKVAIVDCPLEMTVKDVAELSMFTRFMSDLNPQARTNFDWDELLPYYVEKFNAKVLCGDSLDVTGQAIARGSENDFISWQVLKALQAAQ